MALEFVRPQKAPAGIVSDRRLWLTADKARVVEDGDPSAAYLLSTPGSEIPTADAEKLGLVVTEGRLLLPGAGPKQKARKRKAE